MNPVGEKATDKERVEFLEAQLNQSNLDRDMFNAQLHMTVARLGGLVEGNPTGRHNFLQRIDALIEIEADRNRMSREMSELREISAAEAYCYERDRLREDGELEAAASHLRVALAQTLPTDDQIIVGHIRSALEKLNREEA